MNEFLISDEDVLSLIRLYEITYENTLTPRKFSETLYEDLKSRVEEKFQEELRKEDEDDYGYNGN